VLVLAFSLCPVVHPQQPTREETRPRRAQALKQPATTVLEQPWKTPSTQPVISLDTTRNEPAGSEPLIRIALATDARTGSISSNGKLMNSTATGTTFTALEATRVRVEPRLLSPLAASANESYGVAIDSGLSRSEAEQKLRELKNATDEDARLIYDSQTTTWGLAINKSASREEAEALIERLSDAGFDASLVPPKVSPQSETRASNEALTSGNLRLISKPSLPTREVVAFGPSSTRLFSSSAPVVFTSEEEAKTPVRYNDRPYRGRIEVFTNTRGTLTVVNVLGLEDYVRGVVANELSPGSYPALDALKAQAIAARTYALRNRGQFSARGFDLLPTTRSQVYRGLTSENPLSTRAVDETRGMIATYNGEPINALYTSTCGGRTEDSENIFNQPVAYLRGRECALEIQQTLASFTLQTTRELPDVREEKHVSLTRELALLRLQGFSLASRVSDSWLESEAPVSEVRSWLASVARLSRQMAPAVTEEVNRPGPFATALSSAVYGESRADVLLNSADVEYFLAIRDAADVPINNRADVSVLVRDGYLSVYPDATLRPRQPLSRARALHAIARILEARALLQLQKGTARPGRAGELILRARRGKDQTIRVSSDAFLFRQIGDGMYPVRSVVLVGGESVVFHTAITGEVDYLEVRPAPNGAAAERFSPFTNWSTEISLGQLQRRLARATRGIGPLTDLRVVGRGTSRRVTDLEVIGTNGTAHIRNGRIRSALGLREQLFVIDRRYDDDGRVSSFSFAGRGWGHGVGMCQVGAYGLAKQGLTYEQILKTYYTGIEITRLY